MTQHALEDAAEELLLGLAGLVGLALVELVLALHLHLAPQAAEQPAEDLADDRDQRGQELLLALVELLFALGVLLLALIELLLALVPFLFALRVLLLALRVFVLVLPVLVLAGIAVGRSVLLRP